MLTIVEKAEKDYSSESFAQVISVCKAYSDTESLRIKIRALVGLQVLEWLKGEKKESVKLGKLAEKRIEQVRSEGFEDVQILYELSKVYGHLAQKSIGYGIKYGPKVKDVHDAMLKADKDAVLTRILEISNLLGMPKFVGGDPEKALELAEALAAEYPDNTEVLYLLAMCYKKLELNEKVKEIGERIVAADPDHIRARVNLLGEELP